MEDDDCHTDEESSEEESSEEESSEEESSEEESSEEESFRGVHPMFSPDTMSNLFELQKTMEDIYENITYVPNLYHITDLQEQMEKINRDLSFSIDPTVLRKISELENIYSIAAAANSLEEQTEDEVSPDTEAYEDTLGSEIESTFYDFIATYLSNYYKTLPEQDQAFVENVLQTESSREKRDRFLTLVKQGSEETITKIQNVSSYAVFITVQLFFGRLISSESGD